MYKDKKFCILSLDLFLLDNGHNQVSKTGDSLCTRNRNMRSNGVYWSLLFLSTIIQTCLNPRIGLHTAYRYARLNRHVQERERERNKHFHHVHNERDPLQVPIAASGWAHLFYSSLYQ